MVVPMRRADGRPSGSNISVYDPSARSGKKRDASSSFQDNGLDKSKKIRHELDTDEEDVNPSRVLFVRNLPRDCTEHEVAMLAAPFGEISNLVLTRKSGLALLEMVHLDSAREMLNYYTSTYTPRIRSKVPLRLAYSKYPVLNTTPPNHAITEAIMQANERHLSATGSPHCVVLAQVEHAPPNVHFGYDQFYQLLKCFGRILRIIVFRTGSAQKALVEFEQPVSALVAIMQADGMTFRPDDGPPDLRCTLRVDLSRQSSLEVRQEDENCRDFTRSSHRHMSESNLYSSPSNGVFRPYRPVDLGENLYSSRPGFNVLDWLTEDMLSNLDPNILSELASRMVKPLLKAALSIGGQQSTFLKSQVEVLEHLYPQTVPPLFPSMQPMPLMMGASVNSKSRPAAKREEPSQPAQSSVVYVTNLNQERVTADALFTLFGVYGDVQRIKMLHTRKDAALIQFTDAAQAQRAVNYLDKVPLYGKAMHCSVSKNPSVNIPPPGSRDPMTGEEISSANNRVFTDSRLHRFRYASSRSMQSVCAPSRVLYVSQLNDQVGEEDLVDAFVRISGFEPECVKMIRIAKPMALVQMKNLEEAVSALIAMDDYEIDDNTRIRVCFSKSPIRS